MANIVPNADQDMAEEMEAATTRSTIELRFNGRLYKKESGRWYCESRNRWRPVYDTGRIALLNQLERDWR